MTNKLGRNSLRLLNLAFWVALPLLGANLAYKVISLRNVHAQSTGAVWLHPFLPNASAHLQDSTDGSVLPFTAVLKQFTYDEHGVATPADTQTWAVRSDGSRVLQIESNDPKDKRPGGTRFVDLSSGESVKIGLFSEEKSSTIRPDAASTSWVRDPSSNCMNSLQGRPMTDNQTLIGRETVDGYDTSEIRLGNMTWWFAVDYGCAPIRFIADLGENRRSEQRLVSLIPGEPSATLFAVPASFHEVSPSALLTHASGSGACAAGAESHCGLKPAMARRLDDTYHARRAQD